jgi:septal ring factor EnvC (AmiA/AmiB activator)
LRFLDPTIKKTTEMTGKREKEEEEEEEEGRRRKKKKEEEGRRRKKKEEEDNCKITKQREVSVSFNLHCRK